MYTPPGLPGDDLTPLIEEAGRSVRRLEAELRAERARWRPALGRLCAALTCPALEYLPGDVRRAWADACDLLERGP